MPTPANAAFRILLPLKVSFLTRRPRFLLPNPNIVPLLCWSHAAKRYSYKVSGIAEETVIGSTVVSPQSSVLSPQQSGVRSLATGV